MIITNRLIIFLLRNHPYGEGTFLFFELYTRASIKSNFGPVYACITLSR